MKINLEDVPVLPSFRVVLTHATESMSVESYVDAEDRIEAAVMARNSLADPGKFMVVRVDELTKE